MGVTGRKCDEKEHFRPPQGRSPHGSASLRGRHDYANLRNEALGFLRPPEYERLIVERERDRLVHTLREGLGHGETLERMLQRLQNPSAS